MHLRLTKQSRCKRHSVQSFGAFYSCKFADRWEKIPTRGDMRTFRARLNFTRPASKSCHSDSTFVQVALIAFKRAITVKKIRLMPAFLVRSIVRGKHDQCIVTYPKFRKQVKNPTHILIHMGHHRSKGGHRIFNDRTSIFTSNIFKIGKFLAPRCDSFLGGLHRSVRNGERNITKEWIIFVFTNELKAFIRD